MASLQSTPAAGGKGSGGVKSELRNLKGLYPSKFDAKNDGFKTWAEDFVRWVRLESDPLATALERAAERSDIIGMATGEYAPDIRFIWLHLKELMADKESKEIVRTTTEDNGMEAWRLLTKRWHGARVRG